MVRTEWGALTMDITFKAGEEVEVVLIREDGQRCITNQGRYTLEGMHLTTDVLNKGKPVLAWFEGSTLVIQTPSGTSQRFTRR